MRYRAYMGIVDGVPHSENCTDEFGDYIGVQLYRDKADALKRFEKVKLVTVTMRSARTSGAVKHE